MIGVGSRFAFCAECLNWALFGNVEAGLENITLASRPWEVPLTGECPVADTLKLLGGKHTPRILHCLMAGELHFLELTRTLGSVSRKVLTDHLRELEESGLVRRVQKDDARRRVGYSLTDKGRALGPILSQLYDWSRLHHG
jgi:DNA-binding HxlR family transcriptional regulator